MLLFLALACCSSEAPDLKEELQQLTKDVRGRVSPIPQVRPYEPIPYLAEDTPDPFHPDRAVKVRK